jgi:hypothetical protein
VSDQGEIREGQKTAESISNKIDVERTLKSALRICYRNPKTFLGMAAFVALPSLASSLLPIAKGSEAAPRLGQLSILVIHIVLSVIGFILSIYFVGTLSVFTAFTLDQRPFSWTDGFSWIHKRGLFWRIVLVQIQVMIVLLLGFILCIIPGLVFFVWFMLDVDARVLGDFRGKKALTESRRLIQPVFSHGAVGLAAILVLVPLLVVLGKLGIDTAVWGRASNDTVKILTTSIINYCTYVFWSPVAVVALAITYVELSGGLPKLREDLFL